MKMMAVASTLTLVVLLHGAEERTTLQRTLPDGANVKVTLATKEVKPEPPKDPLPPGTIFLDVPTIISTWTLWLKQPADAKERAIHSFKYVEEKDYPVLGGGFTIYDVQSSQRKIFVLYARDLNLNVDIIDVSGNEPKFETVDLGASDLKLRNPARAVQMLLTQTGIMCLIERKALAGAHDLELILAEKSDGQWKKKMWRNKGETWEPTKPFDPKTLRLPFLGKDKDK